MPHPAYGWVHQQKAARLKAHAIGQPCPLCHLPMLASHPLDLDHTDPADKAMGMPGDRVVHASCNRKAGGKLGAEKTNAQHKHVIKREW